MAQDSDGEHPHDIVSSKSLTVEKNKQRGRDWLTVEP